MCVCVCVCVFVRMCREIVCECVWGGGDHVHVRGCGSHTYTNAKDSCGIRFRCLLVRSSIRKYPCVIVTENCILKR